MSDHVEDIFRLTPVQEGMLFHALQAPDSVAYLQQVGVRLRGALDSKQLRSAWESVIARNEVFRCSFVWDQIEHPVQVVRRTAEPEWTEEDWGDQTPEEQKQSLKEFLEKDRHRGIEFGQAPMMRFALFRLSADQWHLVWTLHHVISDGWSIHLAIQQAIDTYSARIRDERAGVGKPTCSFREFLAWRESRDDAQAMAFWRRRLEDFCDPLELSWDQRDPPEPEEEYHRLEHELSSNVAGDLTRFTRDNRLSIATVVNGAWAYLLSRYCNRHDVVFGITVSGRPVDLPGADQIVGPLLNTLPLRIQVDGDAELTSWLASIQNQQHDVREFEWSSLLDVQGCSGIRRGAALFETIAVVTNYPKHKDVEGHCPLQIVELHHDERSHYPLAFIVVPGHKPRLILIADAKRFNRNDLKKMLDYLAELVEAMVSGEVANLHNLPLMPRDDRQWLEQWNFCPKLTCPSTWLEEFDAQLLKRPDGIAVSCGEQRLTYRETNERALRLAHRLSELGAKAGTLVGICMDRSVDMTVAIIGVHRAGAAYVPLDPSYPRERIQSMVSVVSLQVVLVSDSCREQLPADLPHIVSPDDVVMPGNETGGRSLPTPKPTDLAYVIFTSGSTGEPRAVGLSHANLAHSTAARIRYYQEPVGSFLLLSSLSFDSSVAGIFWTLSTGGKLCIPVANQGMEPRQLQRVFDTERVTHLLCIPSLYRELLAIAAAEMESLSIAIMAGESLPTATVRAHFERLPKTRLFNEYGPTEASVWCTVYECQPASDVSSVPIGRAIESMQAWIVDDELRPLPVGVAGELVVGGPGTADGGYLGMAELTAERFVSLDLGNGEATRFFRTGDVARLRNDGELDFLGRNDRQVKLRGYRIELDGLEKIASQHPQVGDVAAAAVTSVRADDARVERLVERLATLDPEVAESLVSQVEAEKQPVPSAAPDSHFQHNGFDSKRVARGSRFELVLKAKDSFVKPPRKSQREWLLDQAINEFRDDLVHLDIVAQRFVSGYDTEREQYEQNAARAKLTDQQIMEDWQTPLMRVMADYVSASHGDVLEIGFGRGVSATFVQDQGVKSHTIIEVNDHSVNHHFRAWRQHYRDRDIRLIHKLWQDAVDELGMYDGILFHAFPLNEKEFVEYVVESVTFAEHFFPFAAEHLRAGGAFTYLTTEIDSLSRRHQRKLYEWFGELTMRVVPVSVPANTRDQWWADSMVAVKAIRG